MIKLVVSDIDGTLVPEGADKVNPELFACIRELKKKGIIFVAASGRQYVSMKYVFEPVTDDIIYIAGNGSNVMCRGMTMSGDYIDCELAKELVSWLKELGDECIVAVSTPEEVYVEHADDTFCSLMYNGYHEKVVFVDDLTKYCQKTNKISLYREAGSAVLVDRVQEKFGDRLNVMVSGKPWIDFISQTADKGNALATIQNLMHISPEETMAFGDNCNDMGMLRRAGESYAVANANPRLKEVAKHITLSNVEDGVIRTIRETLLGKAEEGADHEL